MKKDFTLSRHLKVASEYWTSNQNDGRPAQTQWKFERVSGSTSVDGQIACDGKWNYKNHSQVPYQLAVKGPISLRRSPPNVEFNPKELQGLCLWLDCSDTGSIMGGGTEPGNVVHGIKDGSGHDVHFVGCGNPAGTINYYNDISVLPPNSGSNIVTSTPHTIETFPRRTVWFEGTPGATSKYGQMYSPGGSNGSDQAKGDVSASLFWGEGSQIYTKSMEQSFINGKDGITVFVVCNAYRGSQTIYSLGGHYGQIVLKKFTCHSGYGCTETRSVSQWGFNPSNGGSGYTSTVADMPEWESDKKYYFSFRGQLGGGALSNGKIQAYVNGVTVDSASHDFGRDVWHHDKDHDGSLISSNVKLGTRSLNFAQQGPSITIPIKEDSDFDVEHLTIAVWVYIEGNIGTPGTTLKPFFEKLTGTKTTVGSYPNQYALYCSGWYNGGGNDGTIHFTTTNAAGTLNELKYALTSSTTGWHHFAATYDGSKKKIFLNGIKMKEASYSETLQTTLSDDIPYARAKIGTATYGRFRYHLTGTLNEVTLWDKALGEDTITELYNAGDGTLSSTVSGSNIAARYDFELVHSGHENCVCRTCNVTVKDTVNSNDGFLEFKEMSWLAGYGVASGAGGVVMGEVIVYNRRLTDKEMDKVHSYLRKRWSVTSVPLAVP